MITYTLVADGSSDHCLLPIIDWTIAANFPDVAFAGVGATDLPRPGRGLFARLVAAHRMFPCDLLLVHRDAEGRPPEERYDEISAAAARMGLPWVSIVPVRMSEAWLLISEQAIRKAAGNPNGNQRLNLPALNRLETWPDPKSTLLAALTDAANLGARRRANFDAHSKRRRVAECIEDLGQLRSLNAFDRFEQDIRRVIPNLIQP